MKYTNNNITCEFVIVKFIYSIYFVEFQTKITIKENRHIHSKIVFQTFLFRLFYKFYATTSNGFLGETTFI